MEVLRGHGLAPGVALAALVSVATPSAAQTPEVKRQIDALQSEIRQQQQRLQQLQEQVDRLMQLPSQVEDAQRRASKAEEELRAARAAPPPAAGPKVTMSPGNRPGIAS